MGDHNSPIKHKPQAYYAVSRGKVPGIYDDWALAKQQVDCVSGAAHQKFATLDQAKLAMRKVGCTNPKLFTSTPAKINKSANNRISTDKSTTITSTTTSNLASAAVTVSPTTGSDSEISFNNRLTTRSNECKQCATILPLLETLIEKVNRLESIQFAPSTPPIQNPAADFQLSALNAKIDSLSTKLNSTLFTPTRTSGPTLSTPTLSTHTRTKTQISRQPNLSNTATKAPIKERISNFKPENCIVIASSSNSDQFKYTNQDAIRRTLCANHGPLLIDSITRYKFQSANPRFMIQLASPELVKQIVEEWKPESFDGSTARATIKPTTDDHVGMARHIPLDVTDEEILEAVTHSYPGATHERFYKDGKPLRTIKIKFTTDSQLSAALTKGILFESQHMLFGIELPHPREPDDRKVAEKTFTNG